AALREAVAELDSYDWVVLTSPNGARRLLAELPDARALGGVSVAAIGPGTAAALAEGNVRADLVPERFVAESLLAALPSPPPDRTGRVLLARAAVARDVLPDGLRAAGWEVDVVEAYRTVPATPDPVGLDVAHLADVVTFTSSSTVTSFLEMTAGWLPPTVACIGPVTAATAREAGLDVDVEAEVHTVAGLVDALITWRGHDTKGPP
ncbi:hypothetical protein B7486_62035, partial [cyanobacterium TDX16]